MDIYQGLKAPFEEKVVHWRVGQMTKDGKKGSALAYIDARDVMKRLDDIVGFENWSDEYYETKTGRLLCTLSIKIGDGWVSKSDGAGDTNIEGVKGGISDAFKRAAVKWGIGRYLYYLPVKWVAVENRRIVTPPTLPKWALPKPKMDKVADLSGWE